VYAETTSQVLELRWQALRDIQKRDSTWRDKIEQVYRANLLKTSLPDHPLMAGLDDQILKRIADQTLFETYGSFEWNVEFKKLKKQQGQLREVEQLVARQGEYPDGLLLVIGGFGRVTQTMGDGERTLTYLREGQCFGLDELYDSWKTGETRVNETSLHAVGYLQLLRIPYDLLDREVFPRLKPPGSRLTDTASRPIKNDAFVEWAIDERFINGTQTMLIDTNKCVRCDDCVVACAEAHDGNPRFVRSGAKLDNWMVANACMHCVDPVCLIGCPTGAIHRNILGGTVVINDLTCIGCGTCANACPYDNIRLVTITDERGVAVLDPQSLQPIQKATKCDLCESIPTGPSCQRACAHGALQRVDLQHLIKGASLMG
jgi:Fe-S-cluster-containing dehydrogenase component